MNQSSDEHWPYEPVEAGGATAAMIAELPISCSLADIELRDRIADLREDFVPRVESHEEIPDGCVYWFARTEENLCHIADFVQFESRCCNFLSFGIGLHPGGAKISLRISGPKGAQGFLQRAMAGEVPSKCC